MTYDDIFAEYYPLYRGQATVPAATDREYLLGIPLANNGIRRWDRADGTLWEELYTTAQVTPGAAVLVVNTALTSYTGPSGMRKPGGEIRLIDPSNANNFKRIPAVLASDTYAKSQSGSYAYFVGSANTTWKLYINGDISSMNNWKIDYIYYKKPTLFTVANASTATPEMSDPNFIIQSMLQSRFVNSRNGFAYNDAKSNAIDALRNMVIENNSGSPGNSWNLLDTDQTPGFGQSNDSSIFGSR